jgi:hypothetical protein
MSRFIQCPIGIDANDPHTYLAGAGRLAFYDIMGLAGHYREVCQECAHPMNEPVVDGGLELAPDLPIYSVWYGGEEINDKALTPRQAIDLRHAWFRLGHDDVAIDLYYGGSGNLTLPAGYSELIMNWATSQANALTMAEYGGDYWNVWVSPNGLHRYDINIHSHRDPDGDIARIVAHAMYTELGDITMTDYDNYCVIGTVDISHMR